MKNLSCRYIVMIMTSVVVMAIGCKKDNNLPNKTINNVSYGAHSRNKMDVYLPANRNENDTKVFVWIHGGAWSGGDKSEFANIKPVLDTTLNNYAFISLNYRLLDVATGAHRFPSQEEDITKALLYIKSKLSEWKVSDKVVIAGASAGGHLALLQAHKHNNDGLIKACVAYFPPTELASYFPANLLSIAVLNAALNGTPDQKPEDYYQSSPLNFISSGSIPTIFFHGTADEVVPISQSYQLEAKLTALGVAHDYIYFDGEAHAFSSSNTRVSINRTKAFLENLGL